MSLTLIPTSARDIIEGRQKTLNARDSQEINYQPRNYEIKKIGEDIKYGEEW